MRVLAANGANAMFVRDGTIPLMAVLEANNNRGRFGGGHLQTKRVAALEAVKLTVELGRGTLMRLMQPETRHCTAQRPEDSTQSSSFSLNVVPSWM